MLSARSNCALASAAACASIRGGEKPERDRAEPADALGARERSSPATPSLRCAASRASPSAVPTAARSPSRAAWIASGSTTSMRSAIRLSARQQDRLGLERRVERVGLERRADRRITGSASASSPRAPAVERAHHQVLNRLVAREGVGIALRQPLELAGRALGVDDDRRREIAVDRQQRRLGDILERDALPAAGRGRSAARGRSLRRCRSPISAVLSGIGIGCFVGWPGVGSSCCSRCSVAVLRLGVMLQPSAHLGRARLAVPDLERRQVDAAAVLQRLDEIVAGRGLAVVALEIEVGARRGTSRARARSPSCG